MLMLRLARVRRYLPLLLAVLAAALAGALSAWPAPAGVVEAQSARRAPEQVSGLVLTSADATRMSVLWSAPRNGGSAITDYQVEYRQNTQPSPNWTATATGSAATSITLSSLNAGSNYEVRVRAVNARGQGAWSEILFASTRSDEFTTNAPQNFTAQSQESSSAIVVALSWDAVATVTQYQVERNVGGVITYRDATDNPGLSPSNSYRDNYTRSAEQGGRLDYRVRGFKTVQSATQYTPWSARVSVLFYGAGDVAAAQALQDELAGQRTPEPDVLAARRNLNGAITAATASTGFAVDANGIVNLLCVIPGLIILAGSAWGGLRYRMLAPALSFGWTMFLLSLFAAAAVLGFPIIWPILLTVGTVLIGGLGLARNMGWI